MLIKGRLWFFSLWLVSLWPTLGAKEIDDTPIDIGSRLELFVDDFLIERMPGVDPRLHSPQPAGTALTFSVVLSEKKAAAAETRSQVGPPPPGHHRGKGCGEFDRRDSDRRAGGISGGGSGV